MADETLKEIVEKLEPLIDGNWTNSRIGKLEELTSKVDKIGEMLLFILAIQVHVGKISMDYLVANYKEGWKIDK